MTITISASGISLDGPLVAGEKVAVSVSGLSLAAEDKPTLALLARFPDALLASVELAESETAGTWTGELDTATKQTALFFATARADERRDAALELVAGRVSLARLTVPMANSALCPKPDGSPFASPVYVPVPGPPGQGGDPYDQAPEMDGEASAGTADEYARGDHRHPTDTTRQAVISDLAAIRSGAAAGATAVQPAALSAYRTASAQDAIDGAQNTAIAAKYTKPATGIPASDLASGVIPTALPNPQPLHVGGTDYNGSTEEWVQNATTDGGYGIVTLESATNSTHEAGYAATPLAVKKVADSVAAKADSASLAPAFSSSSTYAVGDYVTHDGLLYKCTTVVSTAGAWNAANWTAVAVTDEMGGSQEQADWNQSDSTAPDFIKNKPTIPSAKPTHIYNAAGVDALDDKGQLFVSTVGGNYWTGNNSVVFEYQNYSDRGWGGIGSTYNWKQANSNIWLCYKSETGIAYKQNFSSGTWHTENRGSAGVGLDPTAGDALADLPDFFATNNGLVFHKKEAILSSSPYAHFALESLPDRTWAAGTWNVGDLVKYDGKAYRCTAAATSSNTTVPSSDTTHWAQIALLSDKADSASLRYAFASPTPSVSGTSATVACEDRAINDFTVATGITSLTITPPAAVTGRARDFFCRVTLTDSSLPTVTLSGGTIDIGATEVAGMTQGVNLLMFTEISSGHWLASRRSAS